MLFWTFLGQPLTGFLITDLPLSELEQYAIKLFKAILDGFELVSWWFPEISLGTGLGAFSVVDSWLVLLEKNPLKACWSRPTRLVCSPTLLMELLSTELGTEADVTDGMDWDRGTVLLLPLPLTNASAKQPLTNIKILSALSCSSFFKKLSPFSVSLRGK